MTLESSDLGSSDAYLADRIFVAVDGSDASIRAVQFGKWLADALQVPWEAIFAETSEASDRTILTTAGEALSLAVRHGAAACRIPSATVADALAIHLRNSAAPHVVLCERPRSLLQRLRGPSLFEELALREPRIVFHSISASRHSASKSQTLPKASSFKSYLFAAGVVVITLALAGILTLVTESRSWSILFLFPVIATAARLSLWPALFAALLSAAGFNLLFLNPVQGIDPWAIQSWLMFMALAGAAFYTWWLTNALRTRLTLSDRSAQESAALSAFAQTLTRVADWTSTADAVCEEVQQIMSVSTLIAREVDGELTLISSVPAGAHLDPLDRAALDFAWTSQVVAGSGTSTLAEASWQFQPLQTSLGVLAILGLAREDGRNPIPADRELLLATIVAQAALALERLRLEDLIKTSDEHQ